MSDPLDRFISDLGEIIEGELDIVQAQRFIARVCEDKPKQVAQRMKEACERYLASLPTGE